MNGKIPVHEKSWQLNLISDHYSELFFVSFINNDTKKITNLVFQLFGMGLILKKYVNADCLLGVWEINEDYETLMSKLDLTEYDLGILNKFSNHARKLEWMSVRVLLRELLNNNARIVYNEMRKPFIEDGSYNISISHAKDLTSIFLSPSKHVGVDLEFMSHRISKVEHKFINRNEKITSNEDQRKFHLYIHWCAKEALYKICDKQDINFKENLTIEAFDPEKEGFLKGWVKNKYRTEYYDLQYFTIDGYILVLTCK